MSQRVCNLPHVAVKLRKMSRGRAFVTIAGRCSCSAALGRGRIGKLARRCRIFRDL